MTTSGMMRRARLAHLGALAAALWLVVAAGVAVSGDGQQQAQQQSGQQNGQGCPTQTQQNGQNGQQPQQQQQGQQQGQQQQGQQQQNGQGQQNGQQQQNGQANANCNNQQPAPLFGGSMSIKKSNQSTDSAALGFNGVDPNGQVQQAYLNAQPTPQSLAKAQAMAGYRPTTVDLLTFEQTGGLTLNISSAVVGPATTSAH